MNITYLHSLLDESINTVGVKFLSNEFGQQREPEGKVYNYCTRLKLVEGDLAIVQSPTGFQIVCVVESHETCQLSPTSEWEPKWIAQKLDVDSFVQLKEDNDRIHVQLTRKLRQKHRKQAMAQFSEQTGLSLEDFQQAIKVESTTPNITTT